jgi:hypothetical protein
MTAKTRHGKAAHRPAHGADPGTPHHRLNKMHAMPNRAEGAPMSAAGGAPPPQAMAAPPQPQDNAMAMAPPGAGPSAGPGASDGEEGDQT